MKGTDIRDSADPEPIDHWHEYEISCPSKWRNDVTLHMCEKDFILFLMC